MRPRSGHGIRVLLFLLSIGTVMVLGFNFLQKKGPVYHGIKVYAVFPDVYDLTIYCRVKINGLVVGEVYELEATDEKISAIRVVLKLRKNVSIPANSIASIRRSFGGFASPEVIIEKGNSSRFLENGDTLQTREIPPDTTVNRNVSISIDSNLIRFIDKLTRKDTAGSHSSVR